MSFLDFASHMYPYWISGALMFCAVWKSKFKDLLSFDKKTFTKFFFFMVFVSTVRIFLIKGALSHGTATNSIKLANYLPLGGTLFVWWEDLIHSLPLALLKRTLGIGKWSKAIYCIATALIMVGFCVGHLYQGVVSALVISLYIPWAANFGQKKGFLTLMAGHVFYDFVTLGIVKLIAG